MVGTRCTNVVNADGDILAVGLDLVQPVVSILMECSMAVGRLATMGTRVIGETLRTLGH